MHFRGTARPDDRRRGRGVIRTGHGSSLGNVRTAVGRTLAPRVGQLPVYVVPRWRSELTRLDGRPAARRPLPARVIPATRRSAACLSVVHRPDPREHAWECLWALMNGARSAIDRPASSQVHGASVSLVYGALVRREPASLASPARAARSAVPSATAGLPGPTHWVSRP
jgi:hypothetical protein